MEASLLQFYAPRDPLAEVLSGAITLRKFRVMCEGIPTKTPDSPLGRVLVGPYGNVEHLLHGILTTARNVHAVTYNSHRPKGAEAYRPEPIPLPEPTYWQRRAAKKERAKEKKSEDFLLSVIARNQTTT